MTTTKDSQHTISCQVGFTAQIFRTNNKQLVSNVKFGYPHLTLKQGPKIESDLINTRPRMHLWPDARYIHRKRTSNMVLKINGIFFKMATEIRKILNYSQTNHLGDDLTMFYDLLICAL